MKKVVIIGCGKVGLTYAYSLISTKMNLNEIVLIDINKEKIIGDYLDLKHSICFSENDINLKIGDYNDIDDADIICITAGIPQNTNTTRLEDIDDCKKIFKDITNKLKEHNFKGIYLVASNPNDIMCYALYKYLSYNPNKILGSGVSLDTARLIEILLEKGYETNGYVLGEHGSSAFIPWNQFLINDKNPNEILTSDEQEEILKKVKDVCYEIINKNGATIYGVSSCLTKITKCILNNEKYTMPLSCYDTHNDVFIGNIATINKDGLQERINLDLTENEQELYDISVNILQEYNNKL